MTTSTLRRPPSPAMRRCLGMSAVRGWLVELHFADCSRLACTIDPAYRRGSACRVVTANTLCPEQDVDLEAVCEVTAVSLAMMQEGRLVARFVEIPPWRGGSDRPDVVIGDAVGGAVAVGDAGTMLLSNGGRRRGTVVEMLGSRCRIALAAG